MFGIYLLFIIIFAKTSGQVQHLITQCLLNIAEDHFMEDHTVIISYTSNNLKKIKTINAFQRDINYVYNDRNVHDAITQELHLVGKWPLLLIHSYYDDKEIKVSNSKHGTYILLSYYTRTEEVVKDIQNQVKKLRNNWEWNPRAKFIIASTEIQTGDPKKLATDIFTELWMSRIIDVIIINPTPGNVLIATKNVTSLLDVYVWLPYNPPGKCAEERGPILLDRWVLDDKNNGNFLYNAALFPNKIPKDFAGCPLMISTFELSPFIMRRNSAKSPGKYEFDYGIEVRIVEEFAKKANNVIIYREAPPDGGQWGFDLGNGTWNGVTGEVARSYSDVGMASLWYRCHMLKHIECVRPYFIDKVRWYVPCAKPYPRWVSLIRVFKLSLWLSFLAAYVIVSFIMSQIVKKSYIISKKPIRNQAYTSLTKCFLNFWAIILEESASNHPPDVAVIRSMFLMWVLYCWAVNTVYQTYLITFLIDPGLQPQISSEDEILASGLRYGTETSISTLNRALTGPRYPHMKTYDDVDTCKAWIAERGDFAFLFSKYITEYTIAVKYMDADGNPRICTIEDDFSFNFVSMFVPKGSLMKNEYDKITLNLMQGGIINLWWEDLKYTAILESASNFNLPPGEYIALTIEHLQSAFYFLILGYILSVVSFFLELLIYRKSISALRKR